MIAGSIFYLLLAGQDLSIGAEQLLNGMYTNYVSLAATAIIAGLGARGYGVAIRSALEPVGSEPASQRI